MTDNEIIKALEDKTHKAEYSWVDGSYCDVEVSLLKNALDLINRQQAEIERLQLENEKLEIKLKCNIESSIRSTNSAMKVIKKQDAEIERLKVRLRKERHQFDDLGKMYSEIRAEAIKEFAERLKKRLKGKGGLYSVTTMNAKIDNLVKEMVGEE